jgi:carbon monoxide dehydrogenase subunit G
MKIDSDKSIVNAPIQEVYSFLVNAENIGKLLPENDVKDFKGTENECSFKVQGGITISLVQNELLPTQEIKMVSGEKSPFPFKLSVLLKDVGGKTEGYIAFDGEVNAFLKMMVKKPLTNLFNHMTSEMKQVFEPEA